MKRLGLSIFVLFLLAFSAAAQNGGTASNGDFQFSLNGATGTVKYDARTKGSNLSEGTITFTGTMGISNEDVDGEGTSSSALTNVSITVDVDCLKIGAPPNHNRAAISGAISDSNVPALIGERALLTVEDNGEGKKGTAPDRFTWGIYRSVPITWTPQDSEVPGDPGWMYVWDATDFERDGTAEDTPAENPEITVSHAPTSVTCQSFSFGSYAFEQIGSGNIQVKP